VITDDVPPGAMAVARARQRNVVGWVERRRAGSKAAEAAAAANAREASGSASAGTGDGSSTEESAE
jgi:bifunctional UDP-N-acetylglucosamine pyrophosphorylase/glucosamine-1-phosphate N-acetyltransferase